MCNPDDDIFSCDVVKQMLCICVTKSGSSLNGKVLVLQRLGARSRRPLIAFTGLRPPNCGPLIIVATAPAGIGHHGPPPVSWDNRGVFVHHAFQSFTHLPETAARTPSYLLLRINQGIYNRNIVTIPFAFNGIFMKFLIYLYLSY